MSDIATTDMIFTFPSTAEGRCIGLCAHQAILQKHEKLSALLSKLAEVKVSCSIEGSENEYSLPVKMLSIPSFSLEAFCCLIRFLYTGVIDLEVKPDLFSIIEVEARQLLPVTRTKEALAQSRSRLSPMKTVSWDELFELADCYGTKNLREYCRQKILASIKKEQVIGMLFKIGRFHKDLKQPMLDYIADHYEELFADSADPFLEHMHDANSHSLFVEALHCYLEGKKKNPPLSD
ncbi:hypothetical protein BGZ79_006893 [Entomortierella chlamydospora]|nr:hypothetical protein BGZ79_006893 [Entomortierella chlamydospora]